MMTLNLLHVLVWGIIQLIHVLYCLRSEEQSDRFLFSVLIVHAHVVLVLVLLLFLPVVCLSTGFLDLILTKPLDTSCFVRLRGELGVCRPIGLF